MALDAVLVWSSVPNFPKFDSQDFIWHATFHRKRIGDERKLATLYKKRPLPNGAATTKNGLLTCWNSFAFTSMEQRYAFLAVASICVVFVRVCSRACERVCLSVRVWAVEGV